MKYIIFPLAIMFLLCMANMLGLGSTGTLGDLNIGDTGTHRLKDFYYDSAGNPICYPNGTAATPNDDGHLWVHTIGRFDHEMYWANSTGNYLLYFDTGGEAPANSDTVNTPTPWSNTLGQSLGFIALVLGIMAVSVIAGFHFFGTGVSEIGASAIYKTTAYLAIWGVLSALTMTLLFQLPMYMGSIMYLAFTMIYCLGIINSVGHPSDD